MAIDLRRKGFASRILGVEKDPVNASAAERIGLVDAVTSLEECVKESDVVIVSVPVGAAIRIVPQVLDIMADLYPAGGCDKVLMGKMKPTQCPLFQKVCSPLRPQGACMVSTEGNCYTYYVNHRE